MPSDRFNDDKATIRAELEKRARVGETITYSQTAALVGRTPLGLSKILDAIKDEEATSGMPDLGCLVVRIDTGLPGYVGIRDHHKAQAMQVRRAVFAAWNDQAETI